MSETMKENIIEVNNLWVEYKTMDGVAKAVNDLSFSLNKGKAHGLVGETGSGKTTTALAILRLVPHDSFSCEFQLELTPTVRTGNEIVPLIRGEKALPEGVSLR